MLLLGSSGYVGSAFRERLLLKEIPFQTASVRGLDLDGWRALFRERHIGRGTTVINCAGFTGKPNVDACELHKAECLEGNAVLPGFLRQACEEVGAVWCHISSGCVFTGERRGGGGFREEDPPNFSFRQNNCSFYSGTKALGEEALGWGEVRGVDGSVRWLNASNPRGYVCRLRIPFEAAQNPRNYITKLLTYKRLLDARNSLSELHEFVEACLALIQHRAPFGIYNLTNPGSITAREVVGLIQASGRFPGRTFDFFASEEEFMAEVARTPRSNTVLDCSKAIAAGIRMREVHDAVRACLQA